MRLGAIFKALPAYILCFPLCAASQTFITQGPQASQFRGPSSTLSGSVQALAISPIDPNTLFAGGCNGGIWRTNNLGLSWTPLTDHLDSLSIAVLAYDLTDSSAQTLIAGVGVTNNGILNGSGPSLARAGGQRIGALYSQDGGNSWNQLPGNTTLSGESVVSVVAQGSFLLAGTFEPRAILQPGGLYKSIDRGTTFTEIPVSGAALGTEPITAIVTPLGNPNTIYVATTSAINTLSTALYSTTNQGTTFTPIFTSANSGGIINNMTQTVLKVATGPSGSIVVGVIDTAAGPNSGGQLLGIFLSLNSGVTWTQLDLSAVTADGGFNPDGQGTINSAVAIDPVNPTIVYASGSGNDDLPSEPATIWELQLSGSDTIAINLELGADGSSPHADSRVLAFNGPGNLILGNDGNLVLRSDLPGTTGNWTSINGNLSLYQSYTGAYDANNNLILDSAQDGSINFQNFPNQLSWIVYPFGGDGINAMINDTSSSSVSYYYSSTQALGNLNRATVSNGIMGPIQPLTLRGHLPLPSFPFHSYFVLNRIDPTKIAFGASGDAAIAQDDLVSSSLHITTVGSTIMGDVGPLAYGVQDAPDALLVGTTTSTVFFTNNATLTPLANLPGYPGGSPADVRFDARTVQRFFIVDAVNLYETIDTGTNFTNITASLPANFIRPFSLEFLSNNGVNALFIGGLSTDGTLSPLAVADSDNAGTLSNFRLFGLGLPNTMINQAIYNSKADALFASAFGRGTWLMYDVTSNFPQATVLQFGLANNDSTPDASVLTGSRPLIKYGPGTLIITGTATYTGLSTVTAGFMTVNGSIPGDVMVNNSAVLKGTGNIGGNVLIQSGGTISPGNPIGTITVGSLTLNSGSLTNIEIDPTAGSKIVVTGAATLAGSVQVIQDAGNYPATGSYDILTAASISGSFDPNVLGGLPGFHFSLLQQPNLVQLLYRRFMLLDGISGNALTFGNYINKEGPNSQAEQLLSVLSGETLKDALKSASPLRNGIPIFITDNMLFSFHNIIGTHFSDMHYSHMFGSKSPRPIAFVGDKFNPDTLMAVIPEENLPQGSLVKAAEKEEKNALWLDGFAEFSSQKAQDQTPGFKFNSEGIVLGYDRFCTENGMIGIATSYIHSNYHEHHNSGKGEINSVVLAPYATAYFYNAYIETALTAAYNHINNHRHIDFPGFKATASSSFHTYQLVPQLGVGYDFKRFGWFVFEPFALFDWVVNWQDDFKERGGKAFNAKQRNRTSSMLRSELGLRLYQNFDRNWGTFVMREVAAYVNKAPHKIGAITAALVDIPSSFTVESFKDHQNLFTLGIAGLIKGKNGFFGMFAYDGEIGSGYISNEVQFKVGKFF